MVARRALLSVNDKTGLEDFARGLTRLGVELIATAGTAASLQAAGLEVRLVSELTRFPDAFLGGRVKTLQPAIYAGLLADRDNPEHMEDLARRDHIPIDVLCLNLYEFGQTDQDETQAAAAIAHIDIGGPMLLRAAALNHRHVAVVTRPAQYTEIVEQLETNENQLPESFLFRLASQAFAIVASYEAQVSAWFSERSAALADIAPDDRFRIHWIRCAECAGAVAGPGFDRCMRHLAPSRRRVSLRELNGAIDLRNVQVAPSLLDEILSSAVGSDGRPRLASLRCEWTQFEGPADLRRAHVTGDVDLGGARFSGSCTFDSVSIDGELRCRDTRFRRASFKRLHVGQLATFRNADFKDVSFEGATFAGPAVFEGADVAGDASFSHVVFMRDASFMGATLHGEALFEDAQWRAGSRFRDASFAQPPVCRDLSRFQEASWQGRSEPRHPPKREQPTDQPTSTAPTPRVFIASSAERLDVARAVQINLDHDCEPHLWTQGFEPGSTTAEAVIAELEDADFAIFIVAPDDVGRMRGREVSVARDNVLLELGLSAGLLGLERTFLIKPRRASLHVPSDLAGVTMVDYDDARADRIAALGAACARIIAVIRQCGRRSR